MPDSWRRSNPPENPYPAYILGMSWKRALPEPLRDKHGNTIRTLADARAYMLALDKKRPGLTKRQHWQAAALLLLTAAKKGSIEAATKQLTFALLMDGLLDMKQEAIMHYLTDSAPAPTRVRSLAGRGTKCLRTLSFLGSGPFLASDRR